MASSTFSVLDIGPIVFGGTSGIISFLQGKQLLASTKICSCGSPMNTEKKSGLTDGVIFRCPNCKTTKSIRDKRFFNKSKLPLQKWMVLLYWWVRQYPVTDAAEEAEVGRDTAINVYQWLREVCSTRFIQNPVNLGGPGVVVQIDESLFRHKSEHHRGRPPQNEVCVFGMVDTFVSPALGYMQIVPQRDATTLLPIIQQHTLPNTTVWSDQWAEYNRVSSLPNVAAHSTVNHSVTFVAPTATHTQNIESYWNRVKTKLKRMKACHEHQLSGCLDEFIYSERYGHSTRQMFSSIVQHIAAQYPV